MRLRILISLTLVVLAVGVAIALQRTGESVQPSSLIQSPQEIKVVVDQLPRKQGIIPVEIQQARASSTAPNQIEDLSYVIRNNTSKAITAATVTQSISYERGGITYVEMGYAGVDSALHPDLRDAQSVTALAPGGDEPMASAGPTSFDDDVVIKEVRLRVDYVLFDDNSSLGMGGEGERRIALMREGAAKYKQWLRQRYAQNAKSLDVILPLLQSEDVPEELNLKDVIQIVGAKRYRIHLLKKLRTQGPAEVEKYLKR